MTALLVLLMVGQVSGSISCSDGTKCQDNNTCCPTKTGYACCQYPSAVCCPDKAHCCPQGYQCDLETQQCEKKGLPWYRIPLSPQIPAEEEEKTAPAPLVKFDDHSVSVVHCDNLYVCPDGTTCCRTPSGQWTCCRYSVGQCCRDGFHCCPFGYQCDSTSTFCLRGALILPASPQINAMQSNTIQIPAEEEEKTAPAPLVKFDDPSVSVVHCDNLYVCPDGTTCCRTPSGQWTCCRYSVGQCCLDGFHCCPFGYHCDSTSTFCLRGALSLPASPQINAMQSNTIQIPAEEEEKTVPAPLVKFDDHSVSVVHCDNLYVCPDGTTCCRTPSGQWTCCRYSVGQCCLDGFHCCPFGYQCDSTSTFCLRGALILPASPQINAMQSNTIQDQCCQSETGCCAIGFHCDEKSKACVSDFDHLPPVKSTLNIQNEAGIIHCSDLFYCPAGNSCCKTLTSQWACCPYALGQCCKDGKHCCEYGYDCDSTFTKCKKGYSSISALLTKEALLL